ncbi:hypothetical protein [uncultured Clostridium sp.]|uniref:hypothetical protein n=1 Tax=uncultured Clostridium sp. TaxID=59620 RepID=UPI0028E8DA68|nr:hypothetical protein [uncultured Clostridium sp.]
MKKIIKTLSLVLVLALSITLIHTKKAYADYELYAKPPKITTNSDTTKVELPTLDVDCYVLYTSIEDQDPDESDMWHIPAGYPNVQDFNIAGTWYLHVYIPSTGQRATYGPYQKEAAPPPMPLYQFTNTEVTDGETLPSDITYVSFQACSKGDNGESGHDNINNCDSYFQSGYNYMEVWDGNTPLGDSYDVNGSYTITGEGTHTIYARSWDNVGNYSDWNIITFTLGTGTTPPPPPVGNIGKITFDPNETVWTNKGKIGEGEGAYPVKATFTGDNPYKEQGTCTIVTYPKGNGKPSHSKATFEVSFPFDHIEVTGATTETVNGTSGTVNIKQEGYQQTLHGEGFWGEPQYTLPDVDDNQSITDVEIPEPAHPVGDSGYYNIDWTKPTVDFNIKDQIFSQDHGAVRKPSILGKDDSFYGKLTEKDNLSGAKTIAYKWTYSDDKPSGGYTNIYTSPLTNTNKSDEVITKENEKPVGDHLYLHIEIYDIAGNYDYQCFGPYEDPIKLTNFEITDIRDPRWHNVFWNDDTYNSYRNVSFKANQLPVDDDSHPTLKNAYPKKGYAFYFDITSEYLYREQDRIEIKPTFYYINGNSRIRADAYYNVDNNPLVKFGSNLDNSQLYMDTDKYGPVLIGGLDKLILTKGVRIPKGREWTNGWKGEIQYTDGKIQWWYGKYYIPSSTFFVPFGELPLPTNKLTGGNILVNFEIIAYKNGVETTSISQIFNYTSSQFGIEGGPKNSNYAKGDTIVYDAQYGINSDKGISVIH